MQWPKFVSQNSPAVHRFDCCEDGGWTLQCDARHKTIFHGLLVLGAYHDTHYPKECHHIVVNHKSQLNVNHPLFKEERQRGESLECARGDGAHEAPNDGRQRNFGVPV